MFNAIYLQSKYLLTLFPSTVLQPVPRKGHSSEPRVTIRSPPTRQIPVSYTQALRQGPKSLSPNAHTSCLVPMHTGLQLCCFHHLQKHHYIKPVVSSIAETWQRPPVMEVHNPPSAYIKDHLQARHSHRNPPACHHVCVLNASGLDGVKATSNSRNCAQGSCTHTGQPCFHNP